MTRFIAATVFFLLASAVSAWSHPEISPVPPEFGTAGKDTLWLTSGDRLVGEFLLFKDQTLDFDSKELKEQSVEIDDIAGWRSPRILTCTFIGETIVIGTAVMVDSVVLVRTTEGVREFARSHLESVIEGRPTELNWWGAKATAGVAARSGNTEQIDFNTLVRLRREAPKSRLELSYAGNFGRVDTVETINNHKVNTSLNYLVRSGVFLTPFFGEVYSDLFKNIDLQYALGAGAGVFLIRRSKREFFVELGVAYRVTNSTSVEAGEDPRESSAALTPSVKYEQDITSDVELALAYSSQVSIPDPANTTHHAIASFSIDLFNEVISLTSSVTWDRVESPRADETGRIPERDDFKTQVGLTVDF